MLQTIFWVNKVMYILVMSMMVTSKSLMNILVGLIAMTVVVTLSLALHKTTFWLSFMLMMTFISGIMTMFMYIISLLEKPKHKNKSLAMLTSWWVMVILYICSWEKTYLMEDMYLGLFMTQPTTLLFLTLVIIFMAIIPPKMLMNQNKGMKTSF